MNYFKLINEQGGVIEDNQIRKLPKCAIKDCLNDGLVLVGEKFVCGKHLNSIKEKYNKQLLNIMNLED